jgi:tRNA(Arg) A34 adenosine deaminase TadA
MNIKWNVLKKAVDCAKKSSVIRGKVGAVIFTRSVNIIASAHNTIFYGQKNKWTIHAEEMAVRKILNFRSKDELGKLYILVVRYKVGSDTLGISRPCPRCAALLKWAGIKAFFTDENGNIQEN